MCSQRPSRMYRRLQFRVAACFLIALSTASAQTIRVDTTRAVNSFIPNQALGAGIDRLPSAAVEKLFTPGAVSKVLTAGW